MRINIEQATNNCVLICDFSSIAENPVENTLAEIDFLFEDKFRDKIIISSDLDIKKSITNDIKYYNPSEFNTIIDKKTTSNAIILLKGKSEGLKTIAEQLKFKKGKTTFEVNLNAMAHNLESFRSFLKPSTKLMPMVKALSYGTGTVVVAKFLLKHKADYFGVAIADEGVLLRKANISAPILIMNPEKSSFQNIVDLNLEPSIYCLSLLKDFIVFLDEKQISGFPIHIKLDTGMNRIGFKDEFEINEALLLFRESDLKIKSVFSHLSGSDEEIFDDFTQEQFDKFIALSDTIISSFDYKIERHILNSAGIERFPEYQFDMARLGIGLYGITRSDLNLKSIGTLKTVISQIKLVPANETVGYSRKGKLNTTSKIATLPIGYGDGFLRILSNNTKAYINGSFAPVIGNICMDMCMIDITGIDAEIGDEVELFGDYISISELAEKAKTIPYEILTNVSQRVKRTYVLDV